MMSALCGNCTVTGALARTSPILESRAAGPCTRAQEGSGGSGALVYDPRFLIFEFTWNLLLRAKQVEIVVNFIDNLKDGRSKVTLPCLPVCVCAVRAHWRAHARRHSSLYDVLCCLHACR